MFYFSWKEQIELLNDAELRRFINNLINYHTGDDIQLETIPDKLVWNSVKIALEENHRKYVEKVRKNQENGKLGGRPKKDKEPMNPDGYKKNHMVLNDNPENPIRDNSKEISDKRKEEIVKSEEEKDNSEKIIENRKEDKDKSKVGNKINRETIFKNNRLNLDIILDIDESLFKRYNPTEFGRDIITHDELDIFIQNIFELKNKSNHFVFNELNTIYKQVHRKIAYTINYDVINMILNDVYQDIPNEYVTENNINLFQLLENLDSFINTIKNFNLDKV